MSTQGRKRQATALIPQKDRSFFPACYGSRRSSLLASTAILLAGCIVLSLPSWASDECGTGTSGDDTFNNMAGGVWELRNYADTDGDGVRDTESTASADFGDGTDSFTNSGILRLSQVSSAGSVGELINLETFTNASGGVIDLADGEANDELFISGTFVSDGGSLQLDVVLDDGASPQTDLLLVESAVSDDNPTLVYINNVGGPGGLTTGNGIRVIEIENTSEDDAFALGAPVIAGAYEYVLYYDEATDAWYLTSDPSSLTFEGVAEYPVLLSGALLAWYADLASLHQRLQQAGEGEPSIEPASWNGATQALGPWLQTTALRQNVDTTSPHGQTIARLNVGIDGELQGLSSGRFIFGAFAGFGHTEQEFDGSDTEAERDSFIAGAHARYTNGEAYTQAILKFEHQNGHIDSVAADYAPFDVDLLGASLETGYRFAAENFYVRPRLRLTYAHAWAGSFEDDSGATIDLEDADMLTGEMAARFGTRLPGAPATDLYLDAGFRHMIRGETEAEVSGLTFTHELPGTVGLLGAGLRVNLLDRLSLALDTSYARGREAEELSAALSLTLNH